MIQLTFNEIIEYTAKKNAISRVMLNRIFDFCFCLIESSIAERAFPLSGTVFHSASLDIGMMWVILYSQGCDISSSHEVDGVCRVETERKSDLKGCTCCISERTLPNKIATDMTVAQSFSFFYLHIFPRTFPKYYKHFMCCRKKIKFNIENLLCDLTSRDFAFLIRR